jgi:hypothetical protein
MWMNCKRWSRGVSRASRLWGRGLRRISFIDCLVFSWGEWIGFVKWRRVAGMK